MVTRIIVSVVAVLALSAGVAYAATELTASDGTQVCVNSTNGLMRVASTCREGEYPLTIGGGGGGDVQVTQNGTFTVAAGATAGETLPLTGIGVSGVCQLDQDGTLYAKARFDAAGGETMDAFIGGYSSGGVVGGQSLAPWAPLGYDGAYGATMGGLKAIATSKDATATITIGAQATKTPTPTCKFLWQAVEAPN